jgi:hypothetical protein
MMYPDLYQQTVTAGMPGVLSLIWVHIEQGFGDGIVGFSLCEGTATLASTPLFAQDIDTLSLDTENFVWDVTSQNLGLDQGTVFTFGIQNVKNGDGARVADVQDNPYSGGELLINGAPFDPPRDLAFRTYVLE